MNINPVQKDIALKTSLLEHKPSESSPLGSIADSFKSLLASAGLRVDAALLDVGRRVALFGDSGETQVVVRRDEKARDERPVRADTEAREASRSRRRDEDRQREARQSERIDDRHRETQQGRDSKVAENERAERPEATAERAERPQSRHEKDTDSQDQVAHGEGEQKTDANQPDGEQTQVSSQNGEETADAEATLTADPTTTAATVSSPDGASELSKIVTNMMGVAQVQQEEEQDGGPQVQVQQASGQDKASVARVNPLSGDQAKPQQAQQATAQQGSNEQQTAQAKGENTQAKPAAAPEAARAVKLASADVTTSEGQPQQVQSAVRDQAAALAKDAQIDKPTRVKVSVVDHAQNTPSTASSSADATKAAADTSSANTGKGSDSGPRQPGAQLAQQAQQQVPQTDNKPQVQTAAAQAAVITPQAQQQAQAMTAQAQQAATGGAQAATSSSGPATASTSSQPQMASGESLLGQTIQTQHGSSTQQAAATQQPRQVFHPQQVIQQINVQISKAVSEGLDRINIQLRPEHLGRIDVRLDMASDGRTHANIVVDRPETLDLLRQDARGLERALADAGLDVRSGDLKFSLRGEGNHDGKGDEKQKGTAGSDVPGDDDLAADAERIMTAGEAGLLGVFPGGLTPSGGVDIRA